MTRAERRRRRDRHIRHWERILFEYWRWERDNDWYTREPGRLAKKSSMCSCVMCRASKWSDWKVDRKALEDDFEGYRISKHNRVFRRPEHPLLRRGGHPGTVVKKDGPNWDPDKTFQEMLQEILSGA